MKGGAVSIPRPPHQPKAAGSSSADSSPQAWLNAWRCDLIDRRAALFRLAGGSLAALFPLTPGARGPDPGPDPEQRWAIIGAVQAQLLPTEPGSPGATEIHALPYLQRALSAPDADPQESSFILKGAGWLDDLAHQQQQRPFQALTADEREAVLRRIASSRAGENWLSTLLLYLLEALLTDPVYGGNPDGIGWRWLKHTPGFPRPDRPYYDMDFFPV